MKIRFNIETLESMIDWLLNVKKNNIRDENKLKEILSHPDYQVEFQRYSEPGLPVCGINYEEAVDFFMNFDRKDFSNPRLQYKKESFLKFYNNIDENIKRIEMFTKLSEDDVKVIEGLLVNGLPNDIIKDDLELIIILIVSIGNSMGWPYGNYIDYDITNLNAFENKDDFLHVTAHEINHIFVGSLLAPDGIKGEEFFLQNFSYEGLAVHYNNNLATLGKPKKYDDRTYCMQEDDMKFYEEHFDEIFKMIKDDFELCKGKTLEEVSEIVSSHYEQFEFMGKKVLQYPTYYFGAYMWGLVDLHFGKEKLYESISKPELFITLYNQVAEEKYRL